jgi:acyl carrier protein
MGLIGCVLMAVYGGGRCILLSPSHFLEDPLRWLRAISRYRATLSAGPNFAFDLCSRRAETGQVGALDLACWAVAVNGAEPVRADVLQRFAATFAPVGFRAEALRPSYGLAEATLLVATDERLTPARTLRLDRASLQTGRVEVCDEAGAGGMTAELVGCGRPLPDQHLVIVAPDTGRIAASGTIGEVWLAGPSIASGYFGRADDNATLFAGDLGDGRGPYYKTGDLGFLHEGALFVTGRLRDLIIIRGKNYYPQDLEASAEASHAAIRGGCTACFLLPESAELVVVAELLGPCGDSGPAVSAAIREAIIHDHGVGPRRVVLVGPGGAYKTPSGKIQRPQTCANYREGRMTILHESIVADAQRAPVTRREPVDIANLEEWFVGRMRELGVDVTAFDPAMRLTDLGFDSLKIVELKADLDRDFGIAVNIADLYAFEDLKSLAAHVRAEVLRQQNGGAPPDAQPEGARLTPEKGLTGVERAADSPAPPPRSRLAEQRQRRAASGRPGPSTL